MNSLLLVLALSAAPKLTIDDCVREALRESGTVREAEGKVQEWKGKLLEVESVYWPKLQGLAYVAPLYGLKLAAGASATDLPHPRYENDLGSWGPYTKLQLILALNACGIPWKWPRTGLRRQQDLRFWQHQRLCRGSQDGSADRSFRSRYTVPPRRSP